MELNLNMMFDKMANFKIKLRADDLTHIDLSNKNLVFVTNDGIYEFNTILYNQEFDRVEIRLE